VGVSNHRETNEAQGAVQLEALVGRDGTVKEVKVLGGHPLPADSLGRAVKQWKYEPAAKDSTEVVKYSFGPEY
jgi:outer membrane biosynthesis protein TonB